MLRKSGCSLMKPFVFGAALALMGVVLVGNNAVQVMAFSPSPLQFRVGSSTTTTSRPRVVSSFLEASSSSKNDNIDYDALMNSNVEVNRLTSMYSRFDHDEWLLHRASDRFYRSLFQLWESPIVESLLDEVCLLVAISLGIIVWNGAVVEGYTDFNGIQHVPPLAAADNNNLLPLPNWKLSLPLEPFLLCGGPLGLLLVFRNDASFGRYNEALHHWEKIVSNFQNMMLMASTAAPTRPDEIRAMGLASWALVRTLQHEVSGKLDPLGDYQADIREKIPSQQQAEKLLTSNNKLYRAQYDIHQSIEPLSEHITQLDKRTLINTVNDVALQCVECERLYTTPIPLLYTRHTLKFLTFWMSLMPFALYDVFKDSWNHTAMIPAMAILTFLFFGIEEIAVSLEEPFSILPLEELVHDVWESIDEITEWMDDSSSSSTNGVVVNGKATTKEEQEEQEKESLSKPPL